uniref:Uncharacterized protein n=1 Tax=Lepeophtheirus salmonis TaxID=72036 RepID=A0A0K2U1E6_LEPSM
MRHFVFGSITPSWIDLDSSNFDMMILSIFTKILTLTHSNDCYITT